VLSKMRTNVVIGAAISGPRCFVLEITVKLPGAGDASC
jgi:hypothetical protein